MLCIHWHCLLNLAPQLAKQLQCQLGACHSEPLPGLPPPGGCCLSRILVINEVPPHKRCQLVVTERSSVVHQAQRPFRLARC